jgi:hypothetical protein
MLSGDPVGMGLVRSLARPGGNITGFVNLAPDLSAKQVQLLVDVIPQIRRVGIVRNPSNPAVTSALREPENAIRGLGLEFHAVDAQLPGEFENAFARLSAEGVKGVVVAPDPSVIEHRQNDCGACAEDSAAHHVSASGECRGWRPYVVWAGPARSVAPSSVLCRPSPERYRTD